MCVWLMETSGQSGTVVQVENCTLGHFGSSHFMLKIHYASAGGEFGSLFFLLHIHKTLCHAAQSVVEGRCPVWLGPDLTWTTSKVGTMVAHDRATASVPPVSVRQPIARSAKDKVSPDVVRDAASTKIQKLEKSLEVMGDAVGPAVDVLKSELDKARQAAKVPPLSVQIAATQDFIKTLGETIDGSGGGTQSRRRRGWPRWRSPMRVRSRRRQCPFCASAYMAKEMEALKASGKPPCAAKRPQTFL